MNSSTSLPVNYIGRLDVARFVLSLLYGNAESPSSLLLMSLVDISFFLLSEKLSISLEACDAKLS